MHFCGTFTCTIDSNGRIKLPPCVLKDFLVDGQYVEVVLYCLPEGAIAIYPAMTWKVLQDTDNFPGFVNDINQRDSARLFSATCCFDEITNQGRLTIPQHFRKRLKIDDNKELYIVGDNYGYELWAKSTWEEEEERLFLQEKETIKRQRDEALKVNKQAGTTREE